MDNDVDEDLIEATIRRVAEARAGQLSHAPGESAHAEVGASAETDLDEEDPIEATIRRVAAAKAAQDAEAQAVPHDPVDEAIAYAEAAREPEAPVPSWTTEDTEPQPPVMVAATEDQPDAMAQSDSVASSAADDAIEAAILRVQEQQAARAAESQAPDVSSEPARDDEPTPYRRPRLVEAEPAQWATTPSDGNIEQAVASLERGLQETNAELSALVSRVDALLPLLERLTGAAAAAQGTTPSVRPSIVPPAPAPRADDDWDEAPQLPRIPLGQPPRPAILRDPSPMTATAEELVVARDAVDSPPPPAAASSPTPTPIIAAKAVAPAPSPAKRGFDLLPRNYRITVEDKRRGVDLVPLHRALLGMDGVKDMSLLSYSNGVAIVSVETTNGIEPDALNRAVSRAMAREVQVEVHNETTMVVKLAED